jgi:hypothetical protein
MAACGGTPQAKPSTLATEPLDPGKTPHPKPPTDLDTPPPKKLLAIDWKSVPLANDADALAVWATIAPTGDDWEAKLEEVPAAAARPLAIALLHGGNFTCSPPKPPVDCVQPPIDEPQPQPRAGFVDPCLRRLLALWSLAQLEDADLPAVRDALRAIIAIPPPESQLVSAALKAVPENDPSTRLELLGIAWRAGQHDIANNSLGGLDEARLIEAVTKHKIDGALEVLSAEGQRTTYLAALADEALGSKARTMALAELLATDGDKLSPELKTALGKAAAARDCAVAAAAAHALHVRGDQRFLPTASTLRPTTTDKMMRAMCVLASYELIQNADEPSLLTSFVPAKGLERVTITYDALAEVDTDGDGDPHTQRTVELEPRDQAVLPEVEDLVRAMHRCTGTTCTSDDREYRFVFKPGAGVLTLARLEMIERPPCQKR